MMSSLSEQTTAQNTAIATLIQPGEQGTSRPRLFFADHLRVALTILVVLHHLAVIYGASSPFYYIEPPAENDTLAFLLLFVFVLINQAYFMGFFFLISGYFIPGSLERKGSTSFLRDRLLRLGIPLLVFIFVLGPIASIGIYQMPAAWTGIAGPFTWQQYPLLLGVGPLWFVEMLLIFNLGYVAWNWLTRKQTERSLIPGEVKLPGFPAIALFVLALALTSYLLRIVVPLGMSVPILGFPSLAYLPQYLSFFILGVVVFRRDWLRTMPSSMGKVGLVTALVATIVLLPLALSGGAAFTGRGSWQSALYALWDSTFSVGICLALIVFFRRFFNRQSRFGRFLSGHAFTVYIIHAPVIVLLALALRGFHPEQLLKFALAALLGVPLCFALAFLVRKLPLAAKIL